MQAAVFSEAQRLAIELATVVVERRLLGVLSGKNFRKPTIEGEGPGPVIELQILTMARHRHIGQMPVERQRCEYL